ncbi:hypothetical protein LUZ60_008064 [Juncus effusus]|nr:hypothetical protein LUZ60_008064 [Juncus effusus]
MDLSLITVLQYLSLFLLFLYLFTKTQSSKKKPTTHGLKSYPFIGYLPHFIKNRHRFLDWVTELILQSPTGTMGFSSPGSTSGIITGNPDIIEHILKTNSSNYPKGERSISMLVDFFGHGIFNSDGEHWKWQRKAASFEFNKRTLRNFVVETVHFEITNRLLPILDGAIERGGKVELQDVLERFSFDNICKIAFGEDPACLTEEEEGFEGTNSEELMTAFAQAQDLSVARFLDPVEGMYKIKKFLNIGTEKRLKESIATINDYAMKIIRARITKGMELNGKEDILSRFASNKDHNVDVLRDIVISFLSAGRETTSTALTWFFWLVSTQPDVEKRIINEIKSVRATNKTTTTTLSFDELREMNYLHAAITESMRLYPPVPLDTLSCKEDDVMPDGTFVGKGWFVTYSAYVMARSEKIWGTDCLEFKPERWLDEDGVFKPESPFRYPVFHGGPRMCLGKEMAYIQMKSIVACMFERFKIRVLKKERTPDHILSLTLKMKGGLPVQLSKRVD